MVLPGVRTDPRTPGGMPDSGRANPGGPVPSVPQGTRQPNMGAGAGEPDPKKIEEMFTQYTSGQITREDLFDYLHGESEGRGGILGLLEGMQDQGMGQPNKGTQPNQAKHTIPGTGVPGGAIVQGGLTSPGAAGVSIPSIKEPLDKRHQQISTMLQGYGLGPADADQMSTILNPHVDPTRPNVGHEYDDDEGGAFGPSAVETEQTWFDQSQPNEMATRRESWVSTTQPTMTTSGISIASDEGVDLTTGGGGGSVAAETVQSEDVIPNLSEQREAFVEEQRELQESGIHDPGGSVLVDPAVRQAAIDQANWEDKVRQEQERKAEEAKFAAMESERIQNMRSYHPMFGGSFDQRDMGSSVQDEEGNWFPNRDARDAYRSFLMEAGTYWDGSQIPFGGMAGGKPQPARYYVVSFKGEQIKFDNAADRDKFAETGEYPDGTFAEGYGPQAKKLPVTTKPPVGKPSVVTNPDGSTTTTDADGTVTVTGQQGDIISVTPPSGGDLGPGMADSGTGGGDADSPWLEEDYLYGKQLFDPQSVDSNKYPGLSELVQSITEGGTRSESLTATVINAVRDMETMRRQEGENQSQRMMQVSIAELDRQAVAERARLDRELAEGVAIGEVAETATLAAEIEKNSQLMREYQLSGMMPSEWKAAEDDAGVPTLAREELGVRQQEAATAALSVEQRREQDLSALFGQYISPDRQPAATALTLDAQKWGWTKTMQEAELTGKFPTDTGGIDTLSATRLAFEKSVQNQKNNWETQRISNEQTSIQNQYNINQQSIVSTQKIEQNKLSEAVAARKAKNQLERDKVQIDKDKLKIETLISLSEPATFLFATRFGLLDNLGIALGVDFSDEMYPGELPSMLEPGTIPTMQQLRAATPAERQIMLAEMAATGGYSVEEALSRVQAGMPGGRAIQRQRNVAAVR